MAADLHVHSKISDGSTEVDEIVLLARNKGLSAISITDHDTFFGSDRAAFFGEKFGVKIIKGTEISCIDNKRNRKVHLLCYLPSDPSRVAAMIRKTANIRKQAVEASIPKVLQAYPISPDMITRRSAGSGSLYKSHVMKALMDAGYTTEYYGVLYRKLYDPRFGLAKVKIEYPDVFDALRLVKESGGVSVLAHPAVYDSYELIDELIEKGLDGIEVSYPRAKEDDEEVLGSICDKHGLIKTGGTDFHGSSCPTAYPLGTCTTDDEQLERMIKLAQSRKTV